MQKRLGIKFYKGQESHGCLIVYVPINVAASLWEGAWGSRALWGSGGLRVT